MPLRRVGPFVAVGVSDYGSYSEECEIDEAGRHSFRDGAAIYELTDHGWAEVSIEDVRLASTRDNARSAAQQIHEMANAPQTGWEVTFDYPEGERVVEDRCDDETEARAAAARIPACLNPRVEQL